MVQEGDTVRASYLGDSPGIIDGRYIVTATDYSDLQAAYEGAKAPKGELYSLIGGSIVDEKGDSNIASMDTQLAYEALRGYVREGLFLDPTKSASVSFARNTIAMNACVRPVLPGYINDVNLDFVSYPIALPLNDTAL